MKSEVRIHPFRKTITMIACASLVTSSLAGCGATRESRIGADDGTDACRAYVVALDSTGNYFAEDMLQGAAVGAIGGALLGGLASGSWKGAAIGAAAGAVAGALGGYWKNKMEQGRDQAILGVTNDMRRENEQLDKTNVAFRQLSDCRLNEARQIKARYAAKSITRDQANMQLRNLAGLARKDLEIVNKITADSDKRAGEYQYAVAQIDPSVPVPEEPRPVTAQTTTPVKKAPVRTAAKTVKAKPGAPAPVQELASLQAKKSQLVENNATLASNVSSWEQGVS